MNPKWEAFKVRIMLGVTIAFLASGFYSCQELKYARSGKRTDATVDAISDRGITGTQPRQLQYHYRTDAGELRHASDTVPSDFVVPDDGTVRVEYLEDTSRIVGHRNVAALGIFFTCLAAMLIGGVAFWLHVRAQVRPTASSRRAATRG